MAWRHWNLAKSNDYLANKAEDPLSDNVLAEFCAEELSLKLFWSSGFEILRREYKREYQV